MEIIEHDYNKLDCEVCKHQILTETDYNPCEHVIYTITSETFPDMPEDDKYNKTDEITKLYEKDEDDEKDIKDILVEVFNKSNFILYVMVGPAPSGLDAYTIVEK